MCVCARAHVYVCVCVCVCVRGVCVRACVRAFVRACARVCAHALSGVWGLRMSVRPLLSGIGDAFQRTVSRRILSFGQKPHAQAASGQVCMYVYACMFMRTMLYGS